MPRGRPKKRPVTGMIMLKQTPAVPDEIQGNSVAEAVFLDACSALIDRSALSEIHVPTLAMYAMAIADCWEIRKIMRADGVVIENDMSGARKAHPLWNTLSNRESSVKWFGEKFGLFPADAEKIAQATDTETNEIDAILTDD